MNVSLASVARGNQLFLSFPSSSSSSSSSSSRSGSFASRTHARLLKSGAWIDIYSWNNILASYSKFRGLADALKLFDEMPLRDPVTWNSLIACFVSHGEHEGAGAVFRSMVGDGVAFDQHTLGSLLKSVGGTREVSLGLQLHSLVVKSGLAGDVFAGSALLDMYARCGSIGNAYEVFSGMPERNVVTWNAMISCYAKLGAMDDSFRLLGRMEREGLMADEATFASILTLIDQPGYYRLMSQLHCKIIKSYRYMGSVVYNAAITGYSACGSIVDSGKIFEEMDGHRDLVSWNSMLAAYASHDLSSEAIKLFSWMQDLAIDQDMYAFTSVLSACCGYRQALHGTVIHGLVVKRGLDILIPVSNALIAMYIRYKDDNAAASNHMMWDALKCFRYMRFRDNISWNSIVTGFSQHGFSEEALGIFCHMHSSRLATDHYTYSAVIRSCSDLAVFQFGQQVHGSTMKAGFDSNDFVSSSLMYMYSKCGVIEDARRVFDASHKESAVIWNSIIFGYAQHGQGQVALDYFSRMQELSIKPDHVTFVGIIFACSHIGLVDEGMAYLKSIEPIYGIRVRMEHYACGVDLLGRAGCLDEAKELIESMPFEPDATVWMALLGACRIHHNMELAALAVRHLLVLDPREHSTYVLLSTMCASSGIWGGRATIQKIMKRSGVSKVPGWSWIEANKKVHTFNAGDRSHSQADELYKMLAILMGELEMTDPSAALQDDSSDFRIVEW